MTVSQCAAPVDVLVVGKQTRSPLGKPWLGRAWTSAHDVGRFVSVTLPLPQAIDVYLFPFVFLFHRLSRHCFGAFAAPGACEASALPAAPFRFWHPRAGLPQKCSFWSWEPRPLASGRPRQTGRTGETNVPQQN